MAQAINKMKKQELVNYISVHTDNCEDELGSMLKKDLVKMAEQVYAQSLQEEPVETPVEETVLDATSAEYFHMPFWS